MTGLAQLGKQGIAFTGGNYETNPEYIFTRLNDIKPAYDRTGNDQGQGGRAQSLPMTRKANWER